MSIEKNDPELAELTMKLGHAVNDVMGNREFLTCLNALAIVVAGAIKMGALKEESRETLAEWFHEAVEDYMSD